MAEPSAGAHVLLMTRAGCHLCEIAQRVVAATATDAAAGWSAHDVDADPELRAEFGDRVPVVLVAPRSPRATDADAILDGAVEVGHFRIAADDLADAIARIRVS